MPGNTVANLARLTLMALLAACSGDGAWTAPPPMPHAAFDWSKSPLTEVQFFNEMTTWMDTSNRFTGRDAFRERQATFEAMARQGFEPAIAAVAVFDFV